MLLEPREVTCSQGWNSADSFALVAYLPGPLKRFLDDLRRALEPLAQSPRAHVTVLPPRSLAAGASVEDASGQLGAKLPAIAAFEVAIGGVELFPDTNVIYLAIDDGATELVRIHRHLNAGALCFSERFDFHPHITLAQNLTLEEASDRARLASTAWNGYSGPRRFRVDQLTLVQYTPGFGWRDLAEHRLAPPAR